jgi:5-methylcytosine-specific restriction endonuclease McrA
MTHSKTCTKCGQTKPRDNSHFYRNSQSADGLRPDCSDCGRARSASYTKENAQANRDRANKWRTQNLEKSKESKREFYKQNKEKIAYQFKVAYAKNPQKFRRSKLKRLERESKIVKEQFSISDVISRYGSVCHLCSKEIDLDAPRWTAQKGWELGLHLDHVIRVVDGGSHTLDNVKPSHAICNLRKG